MLRGRGAGLLFLVAACSSKMDSTSRPRDANIPRESVEREVARAGTRDEAEPARGGKTGSYDGFEKDLAEYVASDDLYTTALANPEPASRRFLAERLKRRAPDAFRGLRYAKVRGFLYWNDTGPQATFNRPGCAFGVLTQKGVPCPSAQVPGIVLDARAATELAQALRNEPVPDENKVCLCGGKTSPMHSYVFYDEADTPLASVAINLVYHELLTFPDVGRAQFGRSWTTPGFQAWYAGFCRSAGMPLCFYWEREKLDRFFQALDALERPDVRHRDRSPLEHLDDRSLSELDTRARRLLCAYSHRNTFRVPTPNKEHHGFTSNTGETWTGRTLSWWECETRFPRCKRALSEVWPCQQAALAGDPGFFAEEVRDCRPLASCLWGFETVPGKKTVSFQHLAQAPGSPSPEGNQGPQFYWIRSPEGLARARFSLPALDPDSPAAVDFSRHDVLVFTHGDVGSGGYSIRLSRIELDRGLSFDLASERPARNQPTPAIMRHPFHMVRVDKGLRRDLPVRFILDGKVTTFSLHIEK